MLLGAGGAAIGWEWAAPEVVESARQALTDVEGLETLDSLRARWVGHRLHAEAEISVDPQTTLAQAHEIAHYAGAHLMHYVHHLGNATIHVGPAGVQESATQRGGLRR
ncbi:cation transporter dimerization domain-containing protein [Blastococcus sp. Marseille-P5729]|uniref:cation transporter dimerization domain-containing protein n=1 Tax=Blastococcus sp. Marseille-P5729 TaxID=2086582 RepID=UPI00131B4056|nr:cation transporter dimerization domain-containing protein [Blastococcus sp. Marseille-P5729]